MGFFDALITVLSHPFGWLGLIALLYVYYACLHVAWDVWRALTTFD